MFKERPQGEQSIRMPLNLDNSMKSRFLRAAVPNRFYRDNQACLFELAEKIGKSYSKLQHYGFMYNGHLWRACCVAVAGDVPFLSKVACLHRSYAHVPKFAKTKSNKYPIGICFCCLAGTREYLFEEFGKHPRWLETEGVSPDPWLSQPCFLKALGDHRPTILQYDTPFS